MGAELSDVLRAHGRGILSRVRTGLPAKVTAYDPILNTVDVEIVVDNPVFDSEDERTYETFPAIPSVPVIWPRAGGMVVRLPLDAGDFVWLAFSELPLGEWRLTGQKSQPVDARRHSIGYPYATPGAFPDVSPLSPLDAAEVTAGGMVVGADGGPAQMIVGGTIPGVRFGKLAVSPVALAVPLLAYVTSAGADSTATAAAMTAIAAALTAIVAIPANAAAAALGGAAATAAGAAATAAGAAATAAGAASGAVPSTLVKAV